ncbi:enoyl-CoA hydratase-related protein [soil metagenome]
MSEGFVSSPGLSAEVQDAKLILTINRPTHRNALDDTTMAAFIDNLEAAATDDDVRVLLIRAAGGDFCSGFDIVGRNAVRDHRPRTASIQRRLPTQANRLIPLLLGVQLPIVCAVRGWAVGIGAQIPLACDFAVTACDAKWWYPFLSRGFTPDSGCTWLLPRIVGPCRARELLILGRQLSGSEAVAWGMAHAAVGDDDVDAAADELASRLAEGPTVAIGLTKSLLNAGYDQPLSQHLADEAFAMELSSRSPDFREGLAAFAQRRSPSFEGR